MLAEAPTVYCMTRRPRNDCVHKKDSWFLFVVHYLCSSSCRSTKASAAVSLLMKSMTEVHRGIAPTETINNFAQLEMFPSEIVLYIQLCREEE